jgi:YaiO family outer membrane protein
MKTRRSIAAAVLCAVAVAGGSAPVEAQDLDTRLQAAIDARLAGDAATAATLLEQLAGEAPDNADIQVQLGFALLGIGELGRSTTAFERALVLAPDYVDANLGLAQIAFRRGEYDLAGIQAGIVLAARPDPDAERLVAQIEAARNPPRPEPQRPPDPAAASTVAPPSVPGLAAGLAVPAPAAERPGARWRVDIDGTFSYLGSGFADWREASLGIGYRFRPGTTLTLGGEASSRFDAFDVYMTGRIDHELNPNLSVFAFAAGTPDPDFRATFAFGGGLAWQSVEATSLPLDFLLDASRSIYADSRTSALAPGLRLHLWDDRASLTLRMLNTVTDPGGYLAGYSLRGDLELGDRLSLFLGYSDAPEFDAGQRIGITTTFAGLSFSLTERTTLRASFADERRSVGADRLVASFGIGVAY